MISYQLMFPGSEVLWCSQVLDLSLLPLVFSLILKVASRLLHPYSTNDYYSVYFGFFCLQISSVSNFCPDTSGAVVVTSLRLTCSVVLWGGRNTANKYHWCVWGVFTVFQPHWVCPCSQHVCFPSLCCSGSRLLCWELSGAGPGLQAFPRSKPLRFKFSGTPQRCRVGRAFVLCPSQVQAAQVTRCLASTVAPS